MTGTTLDRWVGDAATGTAAAEPVGAGDDDTSHWLFSRAGAPTELDVWVLPRAGLVAACSGVTLILGFLAIFARIRFRTAWAIVAVLGLLAAALLQPSVTWLFLQSAFMGAALSGLGLWIQRLLDRPKATGRPARESGSGTVPIVADSSHERPAIVGSDDSTAIRVRIPSTMDFIPSPIAAPASDDPTRSSTLGRT
jgi:hypothetical protein